MPFPVFAEMGRTDLRTAWRRAAGADALFAEGVAGGLDLQADPLRTEPVVLGDDGFANIKAVVVELHDFLAVHADKVAVAGRVGEVGIVLGRLLAQAHLPNQPGFHKEGKGAIDGGPGNRGIATPGAGKEGFRREMILGAKGRLHHQAALGGEAKALRAHALKRPFGRGHVF